MNDARLWVILIGTLLNVVLVIVVLVRSSRAAQDAGKGLRDELRSAREEALNAARSLREEVTSGQKSTNDTLSKNLEVMGKTQQTQLEGVRKELKDLRDSNLGALDRIRTTFDTRVKELQEGNEKKLDAMRKTVDEKLHDTLEKRLGESFKLVSDKLEAVHKGLGEMQNLATGVGDLKRVLSNVKVRGSWAEVQLGAILEQVLTPAQFDRNVHVIPGAAEVVEYAVRLPGPKDDPSVCVWLPIDSKFPHEDYLRLQEAADNADLEALQKATDALSRAVRTAAKDIHDKYVSPPHTTDFAIMFLATEGLYAEVLRQPALVDVLLPKYRVVVAGPTTLAAILSSLRMGFQTLAIEKRASEVWNVLRAVKTEFGQFGEVLAKVKKHLNTASNSIEQTGVRTRAIERKLHALDQLPEDQAAKTLELPTDDDGAIESDGPLPDPTNDDEEEEEAPFLSGGTGGAAT